MAESSTVILDLDKTCRTCLAQKTAEELRSLLENNFKSTISEVTNIQLALIPSLPTSICNECIKYLNIAIAFQKQVHNAESQLRNLIFEESDNMTVIYKSFTVQTVLDNGVISEDCVSNIEEMIGPQKDILIVENLESNMQDDKQGIKEETTLPFFKNPKDIYTIAEEVTDDNAESINYFVTNDDETSNNTSMETEAVNLTKSAIMLNATLTNVIKWAESDNTPSYLNNNLNQHQDIQVAKIEILDQESKVVIQNTNSFENKFKKSLDKSAAKVKDDPDNVDNVKSAKIVNFSCDLCSKTFRFEFIYKKHLLKHGMPMGCELCLLLFKDSNTYLFHVKKNHSDYKPFACPSCEERFFTLTPLKMHFKNHIVGQSKRFVCNLCGKKYFHHNSLTIHQKSHTSLEPYKCEICSKKLAGPHSLRNHLKIHKGEKKHKCDICAATFIHRFSLRAHLRIHTGEKPFACKLCDSKFSTSSYLKIHMRMHTAEKPYVCLWCQKRFVSRCALAAHEKSHTGEKKFQCDVCGWRSTRSADLQTHFRKHTGEKPYNCDQCDKSYKTASNLAAHRRTHLGLKEHICSICNKAFADPRTLKSHIRIHTGETPYQCHICGHRFRQSGQLSAHRKIHQNR